MSKRASPSRRWTVPAHSLMRTSGDRSVLGTVSAPSRQVTVGPRGIPFWGPINRKAIGPDASLTDGLLISTVEIRPEIPSRKDRRFRSAWMRSHEKTTASRLFLTLMEVRVMDLRNGCIRTVSMRTAAPLSLERRPSIWRRTSFWITGLRNPNQPRTGRRIRRRMRPNSHFFTADGPEEGSVQRRDLRRKILSRS